MRLWSLHPCYLDWKGLGALWREGLLAQAVLLGRTRGWRSHPQLDRFRGHEDPVAAIGFYLVKIHEEGSSRGYRYEKSKIVDLVEDLSKIVITDGQLFHEKEILMERLALRAPRKYDELKNRESSEDVPTTHPLFMVVEGDVEPWETGYWAEQGKQSILRRDR
ncbi:MAG: pyrimidine dimer DNA glycosylase/endonuclease V [Candidatus Bathyarchaeota archaeon]|nr:pyrimidine dimer DNA glycosylase/endonuclease V [Candidatus Bathyarchaeota archaeon]